VIVNGGMDEPVAHAVRAHAVVVFLSLGTPEHLPPAAIWDFSQLLDIDVHEFAGTLTLIATDDPTGGAVHPGQSIEAEADENPVHGGGGHAQAVANAGGSEFELGAQLGDLGLDV
jgi:hypothetical protein